MHFEKNRSGSVKKTILCIKKSEKCDNLREAFNQNAQSPELYFMG